MEIQEIWVKQAMEGDLNAFAQIYECIYRDMYRYAYFMLGKVQDAEDMVSEAVMDIYTGLRQLRSIAAFKSWVFTILSNKCRKLRKQYLQKNVSLDDEGAMPPVHDKERDLEQVFDMEEALNQLSEEEREVLLLSVIGGYSSDEIGEILSMNPSTARSKRKRSLEKIKIKLEVR